MLRNFGRSLRAWLRGGTAGFNEAESRLLQSLLDALPQPDKSILSAQLAAVTLVQRQHPGRLVVAYYPMPERVPVLPYPGYEYCLANLRYRSKGKVRKTSIMLHDGRFMSFERKVPRSPEEIEALVEVELHPGRSGHIASDIDREEHGAASSASLTSD